MSSSCQKLQSNISIKFNESLYVTSLIARLMGPTWGRQDPGGPHVGPMNFAIWDTVILIHMYHFSGLAKEKWKGIGITGVINLTFAATTNFSSMRKQGTDFLRLKIKLNHKDKCQFIVKGYWCCQKWADGKWQALSAYGRRWAHEAPQIPTHCCRPVIS